MAYYNDQEEENELDQNAGQGPVKTGAESGIIAGQGGTSGNAAAQGAAPTPDKPGNFVGIKQYLDANKTQAAKLGDQTAGVINTSADQARQSVGALNQAAQEKIKPTQSLGADILGRLNSAPETLSAQERAAVKSTASAKYTGPKNETELGDVYNNAAKATQTAANNVRNSGTEQGRMNLISQVNSKPRTQGMNVFDNTLLQAGGGREKIAQAASANQGLQGGLDAASEEIRGKIGRADDPSTPEIDESSGAIGQTNKAQSDAYKSVTDALNNWKSSFTPKVQQAQDDLAALQSRVMSDIQGENPYDLDGETMNLLGLEGGQRIFGADLSQYLSQASPSDINAANLATSEDYARYAALADLAGEQDLLLDQKNIAQAGSAPKLTADKEGLAAAISEYQKMYNPDRDYANSQIGNADGWKISGRYSPTGDNLDVGSMPPEYIETVLIPHLRGLGSEAGIASADHAEGLLKKWKRDNYYNTRVGKSGGKDAVIAPGSGIQV